ncbi:MAG: 2-oxoglutarate dehydrogenase E1 component [Candidatus Brocadiae bacterium]|nr:2-oxoglutarate dehydrogenase E1 component [Candidatus Brocadiia bacterium]
MADLSGLWNIDFLDSQYEIWKKNPEKVSQEWQIFFKGFDLGHSQKHVTPKAGQEDALQQAGVESLIFRYRNLGHRIANIDPLGKERKIDEKLWNLDQFGLKEEDLDKTFHSLPFFSKDKMSLRELIESLKKTYCSSIGIEYMHIQNPEERVWLQKHLESCRSTPSLSKEEKVFALNKLLQANLFETFLHSQYLGQKRFSLEGAEVLIMALDVVLDRLAENQVQEVVLGMAHRGRLNVLVNTLWKLYEEVFCEFDDNYNPESVMGSGDVRYHKGFLAKRTMKGKKEIQILLSPNPSHLESVNPVVEGITRARQFECQDKERNKIVPMLIHGDAAFSGQGVVAETLNLSDLKGYQTGGTVHIIVNNQIGFTTSPESFRSTSYCTDIAKMLMVPIFHVNGDDPEAVFYTTQLACDYRMEFHKDVVVDILCYRRYGHNESDDPLFTQPQMYHLIQKRLPISEIYAEKLKTEGIMAESEITKMKDSIYTCLVEGFKAERAKVHDMAKESFYGMWSSFHGKYAEEICTTSVKEEILVGLAKKISQFPQDFNAHPKIKKLYEKREQCIQEGKGIDWACAEAMAFATLLSEGHSIRVSGQDSGRGTFSQRHAILYDIKNAQSHIPLKNIPDNPDFFSIYDSSLSEYAVLGFEYGYSLVMPESLVIWEAQFGDFANGAQIIIDQYISAAESKWQRLSGLVLLLPHGYEGQGPEHSSARMERFLQLCAQDNIQVANPTTPSQYFHLLRRQLKRNLRKPLVIFSPKSLLRHPMAISSLEDLSKGHFQEILFDPETLPSAKKILFCNGKIYYDLLQKMQESPKEGIAIARIEQIYPFAKKQCEKVLSLAPQAKLFWVQEESKNMGAWKSIEESFSTFLQKPIHYIGRDSSASPATGISKIHQQEQEKILKEALSL